MRRIVVVLTSAILILGLASCGGDKGINFKDTTIIGNWVAVEENGEAMGGPDQNYLAVTFSSDLAFTMVGVESINPTDTFTNVGTYTHAGNTLTMVFQVEDYFIALPIHCLMTPTRMTWDVINATNSINWVFVRR